MPSWFDPTLVSLPILAVWLVVAFTCLIVGGSKFSDALSTLCVGMKLEPLWVGLVVAPLLAIIPNVVFLSGLCLYGLNEAAAGGLLGSSWFLFLIPLGLAGLRDPLAIRERWVQWDLPLLATFCVTLVFMHLDGGLTPLKGYISLGLTIAYLAFRYHFGKENRYGKASFGKNFLFGASIFSTLWMAFMGLILMLFGGWYIGQAASSCVLRFHLPSFLVGFVAAMPFCIPEVTFAWAAVKKGHSELILGQGLGLATLTLLIGATVLGLFNTRLDPNLVNLPHLIYIFTLLALWGFLRASDRLWRWQSAIVLLLTLATLGLLIAQANGLLVNVALPRVLTF